MGFGALRLTDTRRVRQANSLSYTSVIEYSLRNGDLLFRVQVVPRASRSEIVGAHNGSLRVRLTAPPVDDAANAELKRLLAKSFKVPRSAVELLSGQRSRTKQIRIMGVNSETLKLFIEFTNLCAVSTTSQ